MIFSQTKVNHVPKMFFDGEVNLARYDNLKYEFFDILADKQDGFFWRPQEISLSKDIKDFRDLAPHEQHIFTSNLKRQIVLDSVQGRAPMIVLQPICSLPEIEAWLSAWTDRERIHSRSYTHIIRNIYSNPSIVFDSIMDTTEIMDCAKTISMYYDKLHNFNQMKLSSNWTEESEYAHKKSLWLCLNSINALEGIRFYVSFACSWAFAETKRMEGNAKIIKLICRDENLHLAGTQKILAFLPDDDKNFKRIAKECRKEVDAIFHTVVEQEKAWADYLFKDGSMIGLNANILKDYIEWIAGKRMKAIQLNTDYKGGANPLPWTQKWISGGDVQVAPQETEISSYIIGGIYNDLEDDSFKDFKL